MTAGRRLERQADQVRSALGLHEQLVERDGQGERAAGVKTVARS